jgi:phosphoglycolate phosphatase-like HAD superfamily hydrolase
MAEFKTPEDYNVILWDFDGVIIDSNSVRELGFREVLRRHEPEQVEKLIDFHNANGGWSRYVKFRYFYEEILKRSITDNKVRELANSFSSIMEKNLSNPGLLIDNTIHFIEEMYSNGKQMHIVSGSDGNELRSLCEKLELSKYFLSINGSPTPKTELVRFLIHNSPLHPKHFCLIGDALNDYDAANENGIKFYGYNNPSLKKLDGYIDSFLL